LLLLNFSFLVFLYIYIRNFTALRTGDIVVGCSDGIVRIFSAVPSRYASPELLEKFEEEVLY
jgi:hypothetical protein